MRPGELLRQLDRRLLPPLAHRVAHLDKGPVRSRVLTWTALLSVVAVLVTALWTTPRRTPVPDMTVGEVVRVGVAQGQSIPGYVDTTRAELAALLSTPPSGPVRETYALVTFADYQTPGRLPDLLDQVAVAEVFTRVPLAGVQTQIVRLPAIRIPGDVVAGMLDVAGRKDVEARDYQARSATLGDGADRTLRDWYDGSARVALAEATAYRSACSCVYAAVVRATPVVLDQLTTRVGVRAVDPAPEVQRLERAVFTPPLPEQRDVVQPPADTAVPRPPTSTGPATAPFGETDGPVSPTGPGTEPTDLPTAPAASEEPTGEPASPSPPVSPGTPEPPPSTPTGDLTATP